MNVDLTACIAGSKSAWDEFVRAAAPVIFAAVRRSHHSRGSLAVGEIDDRVQDVFMRLLRDDCKLLRTFDPRRASLVTWLTIIARTVVHEHARKKHLPTTGLEGREPIPAAPSPTVPDSTESAIDARLPLSALSVQQRQVIQMLFQEGLSVEQAAARLGVEAQTIRSAKHKALSRLRERLSEHVLGLDSDLQSQRKGGDAARSGRYNAGDR